MTLATFTLSTMAMYSMQTTKIPRAICDNVDKKFWQFIWGGSDEHRKVHLISWEMLQNPKDEGGIGITSAKQENSAFLTKREWIILSETNSLWARVLRSKYCKGRVMLICLNSRMECQMFGVASLKMPSG